MKCRCNRCVHVRGRGNDSDSRDSDDDDDCVCDRTQVIGCNIDTHKRMKTRKKNARLGFMIQV